MSNMPDFQEYRASLREELLSAYTTVYACLFSPAGTHLLCGTSHGTIAVWQLSKHQVAGRTTLGVSPESGYPRPDYSFKAHSDAVYSLEFAGQDTLLSGSDTDLRVWNWCDIIVNVSACEDGGASTSTTPTPRAHLAPKRRAGPRESCGMRPETNSLSWDAHRGVMYAAGGECSVSVWDVEREALVGQLGGASDYLHCVVAAGSTGQVLASSEDGTVRIWDSKSYKCTGVLDPSRSEARVPTHHDMSAHSASPSPSGSSSGGGGKWISSIAVDGSGNWVACGGGVGFLSVWHLGSRAVTAYMPTQSNTHSLAFWGSEIVSVGNEPYVTEWYMDGRMKKRFLSSNRCLYAIATPSGTSSRVGGEKIATGGQSAVVDLYSDLFARTMSFSV
eukprot:TRINITY_DN7631_c0_g1_i1.p1 TRINITY_DN7631_c0_g1~~TRINITY_DN7631_c0_g1_i1.p1  ORF type:complete len:389 (-),score=20.83 TRINITY_DN7631_c0_g1_i1:11-1177(-)